LRQDDEIASTWAILAPKKVPEERLGRFGKLVVMAERNYAPIIVYLLLQT
jgi:hypothetical protein